MSKKIDKLRDDNGYVIDTIDEAIEVLEEIKKLYGGDLQIRLLSDYSLIFDEQITIKTLSTDDVSSLDYKEGVNKPALIGIMHFLK